MFLEVEAVADMTRVTTRRELADDEKNVIRYDKRYVSRSGCITSKADTTRGLMRAFSYRGDPALTMEFYRGFYATVMKSTVFEVDPTALAAILWLPPLRNLAVGDSAIYLTYPR